MPTAALHSGYSGPTRDRVENFHGAQLVFVHWEGHNNFCSAITLPLPRDVPFGALTAEILPSLYSIDPDWASVDLGRARWMLDGENWSPSPEKSLGELGVGHKSLIRFWTQEGGNA
ncbi:MULTISPECIES: phenol hydroxylase subunit P4 [Sphingomonas]|jgi:phenol hydroxylase P4 protein|uniref:Phenol hydroxylase n=1 Tax=Sphingomonas melonis TY TaxID=621456 RepID=A0A175Y519_9SPHN|nr:MULTISPECIES: phenol hydroxylase subunit P4 [Sphingomonas]AOW25320.1 phenol hydroxylase [Sphingomonas melonis TY]KZB95767.1 phenol hydroxylase [Sphingomonas melonis TY]WCP73526.1 phenol hydroxylase subunit P4 [Sphingomonas hankookensis]|tara:strand:+ start:137 stop:484 length:348 start_codon:yes stop_codon:yes gene_type:complete